MNFKYYKFASKITTFFSFLKLPQGFFTITTGVLRPVIWKVFCHTPYADHGYAATHDRKLIDHLNDPLIFPVVPAADSIPNSYN